MEKTRPVHWEGTVFGGVCSMLAVGLIFGFASMLVVSFFGPENVLATQFVLPARAEYLDDFVGAPFATVGTPLAIAPALVQGLVVQVAVMGSSCGVLTLDDALLDQGEFLASVVSVNGTSSAANGAAGAAPLFVHTFKCPTCFFSALSQLKATFSGDCQSFAVVISSVSARGALTVVSFLAEPPLGSYLAQSTIVVSPFEDVVIDLSMPVNGQSRMPPAPLSAAGRQRGILFTAEIAPPELVPAPPPTVTLLVTLAAAPTFVGTSFLQKFFYVDLMYQLLATLALGAFFTYAFLFVMERFKRHEYFVYQKEKGHIKDAEEATVAWGFMWPGRPIAALPKFTIRRPRPLSSLSARLRHGKGFLRSTGSTNTFEVTNPLASTTPTPREPPASKPDASGERKTEE